MKLNVNQLGTATIDGTVETHKIKMSENSEAMQFKIFTSNVYSNAIGTVVREITSNCFDSHREANIEKPVLIKLSKDNVGDNYYLSFIDFGVGMSPKRMEETYSVLFESTKRDSNNQIGAFGIGSKTPLAYKRYSGDGENEYDNSFFVNTVHDNIKYQYVIMEGSKSPEYALLHSEETTNSNGTEIRIPVLYSDINEFAKEIRRQLFYFENLVFEGFDLVNDKIENDYTIYKGEHFKCRTDRIIDGDIHVCLGGVYYPINFNVLNLNSFDYRIPIALDISIGDIDVTVSRESLDYSKLTVKVLKNKLKLAVEEIKNMKIKQNEGVVNYIDFIKELDFKNKVKIGDKHYSMPNIILDNTIKLYPNFKYKKLNSFPKESYVIDFLFESRQYGDKYVFEYNGSFYKLNKIKSYAHKLYFVNSLRREFKLVRIKQSFLKAKHGAYHILYPRYENWEDNIEKLMLDSGCNYGVVKGDTIEKKYYIQMVKEVENEIKSQISRYEEVEVNNDFQLTYNVRPKVHADKSEINVDVVNSYRGRKIVTIDNLAKFHGKIVYAEKDNPKLNLARRFYNQFFDNNNLIVDYVSEHQKKFDKHYGIAFIYVAKTNQKKIKNLKNCITVDDFFEDVALRKIDKMINFVQTENFLQNKSKEISELGNYEGFYLRNTPLLKELGVNYLNSCVNFKSYISVTSLKDIYSNIDWDSFDENEDLTKMKKSIKKLITFHNRNIVLIKMIGHNSVNIVLDDKEFKKLVKMFKI